MLQSDAIRSEKHGATYQRKMNKVFKDQIGKMAYVYMEYIIVKSIEKSDHVTYL